MNRVLLLVSAAIATPPPVRPAQSPPPATRRAHEVVTLINTATPATIRAYVDTAMAAGMRTLPAKAHIDFLLGQREQTGGLDWVDVQEEVPHQTTTLLRRKLTGDLMAVQVLV